MSFGRGSQGGPRYGWGSVRGTQETGGGRTQWQTGMVRGQGSASPEAGLRRGEWQWRGHGPDASAGYARFGQDARYDREYGAGRGGMERGRGYDRGFGAGGQGQGMRGGQGFGGSRGGMGGGGMRGRDIDAEMNNYGHGQAPAYNRFYGYDPDYQRARQNRYGADYRPRDSF